MASNLQFKTARKRLGMSQGELASLAGISKRTYQRYETGERIPSATTLKALARALKTTTDNLYADGGDT